MTAYAGFCIPIPGWGPGDVGGTLLRQTEQGWEAVAGHLSSNPMWSEHDIFGHFQRRAEPAEDDTLTWHGLISTQAEMDAFEAEHPPVPDAPAVQP